jgi:hypothetical protein
VRAILEAAEKSAAELRAEAAQEIDGQLERAETVAARLSERANQMEQSLQALADSIRDQLSALKADLEELRAVGEGVAEIRAGASAATEPAPAEPAPAQPPPAAEAPAPARAAAATEPTASPLAAAPPAGAGNEGARVIALNMALNGSPREETARYLGENFELESPDALLDEVYARVRH